jgi:hypothetical protein
MDTKYFAAAIIVGAANWFVSSLAAAQGDPCSLLTSAQVGAALGTQVGDGKHLASTVCEWTESQPGGRKKLDVTLLTESGFAAAKTPIGGIIMKTPVSGVGDDAVFTTTGKVSAGLSVKKGGTMFTVRVLGVPLDQPQAVNDVQAKEKALALQIVSKL